MNHTDARILKLRRKGMTPAQIAKKIGRPDDLVRVGAALRRHGDPMDEDNEA